MVDEAKPPLKGTSMRRLAPTLLLTISLLCTGATAALADEYRCTGSVGSRTLDNVKVPDGRTCRLTGTVVKGTISVGSTSTLIADDVRVVGNVQGENAERIEVRDSRVGGSVQIVQGRAAEVRRNSIGGDILFDDQRRALVANRNEVGGNIQAFANTGGVELRRNRVDGNLQCKANDPRPVGGSNSVEGSKEDQCSRL